MSRPSMSDALEAGREQAGLSVRDLWVAYWAIGGSSTPHELLAFLDGTQRPTDADYDVVAQALNDHFVDRQLDHPVPYAEDVA